MAKKLNLPAQLLEQIGDSDSREWRENHNLGGKRKSRKETRKEQRSFKKLKRNPRAQSSKAELPTEEKKLKQPTNRNSSSDKKSKDKGKLKSDVFMKPFMSAHEEELRKKDEEDAKYYAKKLGLKSLKLNKEDDGLDDLLGDLDYDNFNDGDEDGHIETPSEGELDEEDHDSMASEVELLSGSDDENFGSDLDDSMSAEETMAKLAALKKAKLSAGTAKQPRSSASSQSSQDDLISEDDFDKNDDDNENLTAEETMARLAALKKGKTSQERILTEEDLEDDDEISGFDGFSGDEQDGSEEDSGDEDDFDSDEDDFGSDQEEMTAEETMAKLAAVKKTKAQKSGAPLTGRDNSDDAIAISESDSDMDADSDSDSDANPYVPPTRRAPAIVASSTQLSETMVKAQRKFKSALNKLTESTLPHVANEISLEFLHNSRAEASEVLTDQLLELVGGPQSLQHTMYTVYAGLVAALYQVQGVDFGGALLQKLVPAILKTSRDGKDSHDEGGNRNSANLLSLLVEMYTLHVVGSKLMYDLLKNWLNELATNNESPVEMLLIVVRDAGSQLRSDDPLALKQTILLVQQRMQQISTSGQVSARARFMMDSIIALKNNRQKPVSELVVSLRHRLRISKLLSPSGNANTKREPLQVGLQDILDSETRGKWWLVGASWKGHQNSGAATQSEDKLDIDLDDEFGAETPDWLELARKQRLNTDVRRAVFVALMGAEDYLDACLRIDKLGLKNRQERDVPHVVLHCLVQEPAYNPYYALVAGKQCAKHSLMKTFQFRLWDWLSEISDGGQDMQTAMQYARFYASLVLQRKMTLDVLKSADFLGSQHHVFLEVFLVTLYKEMAKEAESMGKKNTTRHGVQVVGTGTTAERDGKELTLMLTKIKDAKVLRGLQLYHSAVVNSEAVRSNKDRARVIWAAELVAGVIDELVHRQRD